MASWVTDQEYTFARLDALADKLIALRGHGSAVPDVERLRWHLVDTFHAYATLDDTEGRRRAASELRSHAATFTAVADLLAGQDG